MCAKHNNAAIQLTLAY